MHTLCLLYIEYNTVGQVVVGRQLRLAGLKPKLQLLPIIMSLWLLESTSFYRSVPLEYAELGRPNNNKREIMQHTKRYRNLQSRPAFGVLAYVTNSLIDQRLPNNIMKRHSLRINQIKRFMLGYLFVGLPIRSVECIYSSFEPDFTCARVNVLF